MFAIIAGMTTEQTAELSLEQKIEAKAQEIEKYKGILDRYESGRWMSMGRRHLEDLQSELAALKKSQTETASVSPDASQTASIVMEAQDGDQIRPIPVSTTPSP